MNILNIAYYTGIKYFRNALALCFFVVAPLLFLYLMGVMVNGTAPDVSQKEKVGYYTADKGQIAAQFSQLLHSEKISENLAVSAVSSLEDGIAKVKNGGIDSFIYIGQDFSDRVKLNEKAEIKVYKVKAISAANMLVDSFVNSINSTSAIARLGGIPAAMNASANASDSMTSERIETKGKAASNKDMASISCLMIFIFYGALLGSNTILSESNKNTYIRLRCAPVSPIENFTGKLLGNVSVMLIFVLLSALEAQFIFNVNLNGNLFVLLLTIVFFLVIINSLGILLARLTKNIYLCGLFTFALNYLMVYPITSNAFTPGEGTVYDITRFISPHYYTFQAIFGSIYKNTANVPDSIAVLALMALILCSASWLAGRRLRK